MSEDIQVNTADEPLRKILIDFLRATVTLKQAAALYGRNNVTFKEAEARWHEAAGKAFKGSGKIEIIVAGTNLFVGEMLMDPDSSIVGDLVENMRSLIIRRLTFTKVPPREELYTLLEMLSSETKALLLEGGPVMFLADRGVKSIQSVENVYMKRLGEVGKSAPARDEISEDDLRSVGTQLKNLISLRGRGMELRKQESDLLADLGRHPTFMGELLKEMSGEGEGNATAPERYAQAGEISDTIEALFGVISKDPVEGEKLARQAFSGALKEMEEPLRLELLATQFREAGQLPPVLDDEVFDCSTEGVGKLILDTYERDRAGLGPLAPLLERLIKDKEGREAVINSIKEGCTDRGLDDRGIAVFLEKVIGASPTKPLPGSPAGREEAQTIIEACLAQIRGLGDISVDRDEVASYITSVGSLGEAVIVFAELVHGKAATVTLTEKAGRRVGELVEAELFDNAGTLFDGLIKAAGVGNQDVAESAKLQLKELWERGDVRSILVSPIDIRTRSGLLALMVQCLPQEDAVGLWEKLLQDKDTRVHELLIEAGSSVGQAVAEMIRSQISGGGAELLSRSATLLGVLPAEASTPILEELCRHPQPTVRLRAISVLGKVGGEKVIPLLQVMAGDSHGEVKCTAIALLGHLAGGRAMGTLLEIVENSGGEWDVKERALACRALSKCGDESAVPVLARLLAERRRGRPAKEQQALRASLRFTLESIGGGAAATALRQDDRPRGWSFWNLFRKGK